MTPLLILRDQRFNANKNQIEKFMKWVLGDEFIGGDHE